MGVFELTRAQYARLMPKSDKWKWTAFRVYDARPMESHITYDLLRGATKGSQWPDSSDVDEGSLIYALRQLTKEKFDLPTEGQWEYACRAGMRTAYNNGTSTSAGLGRVARYADNGGCLHDADGKSSIPPVTVELNNGTMTVGGYAPNAWGLFDMHGNVAELCRDWAVANPSGITDDTRHPQAADANGRRVFRGQSWYNGMQFQRAEQREGTLPDKGGSGLGVRLAMEISE